MNAKLNAHVLLKIAECQESLGNSNDALKYLGKALKYRPRYPEGLLKRGEVYLQMNKYEEAIEDLQEAMDLAVWMQMHPQLVMQIEQQLVRANHKMMKQFP